MKGITDMIGRIGMMEIKDMIAKDDIIVWTNAFSMSAIDTYMIAILLNSCSPFKSEIKPGGTYHLLPDERFIPPPSPQHLAGTSPLTEARGPRQV